MQLTAIVLSVLVFTVGVIFSRSSNYKQNITQQEDEGTGRQEDVLGTVSNEELSISPTPMLTPTPTLIPARTDIKVFTDFIYPGAEVLSELDEEMALKSQDSSQKIVEWYKERISKKYSRIKNFVVTKTNGTELDTLTASDTSGNVTVEISKGSTDEWTTVNIKLSY
jgi:hypothetical protein